VGTDLPSEWADDKSSKARRYAEGEVASTLRKAIAVMTPTTPVCAWIGVACNGGRNENTTGLVKGDAAERTEAARTGRTPLGRKWDAYARTGLSELGPFGVEADKGPKPVGGPGSWWWRAVRSVEVANALGRDVLTDDNPGASAPGAWYDAIDEQVATGVWNNRRHGREVFEDLAELAPDLCPELDAHGNPVAWDLWGFFLATSGWSAGTAGILSHVRRYRAQLVAAAPEARVATFLRCAATYKGGGTRHQRPSHTALRWRQKHQAMLTALAYTGEGDGARVWLADGITTDRDVVDAALVRSAEGRR
jgi:hypothetical protein